MTFTTVLGGIALIFAGLACAVVIGLGIVVALADDSEAP